MREEYAKNQRWKQGHGHAVNKQHIRDPALFIRERLGSFSQQRMFIIFASFVFEEFADASARFYCRVYYAEQFQTLRKLLFPDGEERFVLIM